jgi:hypothetical protein
MINVKVYEKACTVAKVKSYCGGVAVSVPVSFQSILGEFSFDDVVKGFRFAKNSVRKNVVLEIFDDVGLVTECKCKNIQKTRKELSEIQRKVVSNAMC